jgi:hypothetical protein
MLKHFAQAPLKYTLVLLSFEDTIHVLLRPHIIAVLFSYFP